MIRQTIIRKYCKQYDVPLILQRYWEDHPHCEVNHCWRWSDFPHHIRTRGAGGTNNHENLLALCTEHHNEIHFRGVKTFAADHPEVEQKILRALEDPWKNFDTREHRREANSRF